MDTLRWTSQDLALLPEDDKRYEVIDGELYVSKQPYWEHQYVSGQIFALLNTWSLQTKRGKANLAPGVIFSEDNDVAPDVIWISRERLTTALQRDGKLHSAPELVVEILSPGTTNENRDRDIKLKLYSRRGVQEYWVVNWPERSIEVYRREHAALSLNRTLSENDLLESPLLPDLRCQLNQIFTDEL